MEKYCSKCGKEMRQVDGDTFDENTGKRNKYWECPTFTEYVDDWYSSPRTKGLFGMITIHQTKSIRDWYHDSERKEKSNRLNDDILNYHTSDW